MTRLDLRAQGNNWAGLDFCPKAGLPSRGPGFEQISVRARLNMKNWAAQVEPRWGPVDMVGGPVISLGCLDICLKLVCPVKAHVFSRYQSELWEQEKLGPQAGA